MAGDSAYLIGPPSKVYRFCYRAGMHMQRVRSVMVVGGGRIAYYLARHLIDADIKLKIVEISHERCVELSEALPEALVIHGDGSDDRLLASESLAEMDCFVSLTGMDEENLMTGLLAKRAGVPKVVVKINRAGYTEVIQGLGIDNIIRTRGITANTILRYVRSIKNALGNPVNSLYRVIEGRLEAIEFTASRASPVLGVPLRKLRVARGILVGVIVRQNEIIIPHGNDEILLGDRVILITEGMELNDLSDILASGGGVVT
jgi:trk system potassium uptake protein TrkA